MKVLMLLGSLGLCFAGNCVKNLTNMQMPMENYFQVHILIETSIAGPAPGPSMALRSCKMSSGFLHCRVCVSAQTVTA